MQSIPIYSNAHFQVGLKLFSAAAMITTMATSLLVFIGLFRGAVVADGGLHFRPLAAVR